MKNNFPRMAPGCLAELQAWQTHLRPRAAALLLSMLYFQESMVRGGKGREGGWRTPYNPLQPPTTAAAQAAPDV